MDKASLESELQDLRKQVEALAFPYGRERLRLTARGGDPKQAAREIRVAKNDRVVGTPGACGRYRELSTTRTDGKRGPARQSHSPQTVLAPTRDPLPVWREKRCYGKVD